MSPRDAAPAAAPKVAPAFSSPADFAAAKMARDFPQPTVPADLICLKSGYFHDEMYLDLWGDWTEDGGFDVQTVTATGDQRRVCLASLAEPVLFKRMGDALDMEKFKRDQRRN